MVVATFLLDGTKAPPELLGRIRTRARQELPITIGALVGLAATVTADEATLKVAERWVDVTRSFAGQIHASILEKLEGPPEDVLPPPEDLDLPNPHAPVTVSKVGRNDPCPCGRNPSCSTSRKGPRRGSLM